MQALVEGIERHRQDPGLVGLLAQMFSLELERPPKDPVAATKTFTILFEALGQRSRCLTAFYGGRERQQLPVAAA